MAPPPSDPALSQAQPQAAAAAAAAQPPSSEPPKYHGTPSWLHSAAMVASVVAPVGLVLPGRGRSRLTLQNAILGGGTFWGLNQLAFDFTGQSIVQRSNERWARLLSAGDPLPAKAREAKARMEAERARREAALPAEQRALLEEARRKKDDERAARERGVLGKVWMGNEKEGWREHRDKEEKEALDSGKGYGDMIMEQIWDVIGMGSGDKKTKGESGDATAHGTNSAGAPNPTKRS